MLEAKDLGLSEKELKDISAEVLNHSTNPRNYGQMEDATCIGKCINEFNGEFVIVYQKLEDGIISDISFVTNGCKDMTVSGSLFTEMVKGDNISNAKSVKESLEQQLQNAPQTQKDAGTLVLKAFEASLEDLENSSEEMKIIIINKNEN